MSSRIRSIRLNTLLKLALNGATLDQLSKRCKQWGVTQITEKSYIDAVRHRIKMMKK